MMSEKEIRGLIEYYGKMYEAIGLLTMHGFLDDDEPLRERLSVKSKEVIICNNLLMKVLNENPPEEN